MNIGLGQPVLSSDGQKLGAIDRVILNPESHRVEQFVIHQGLFLDQDKIVPRRAIAAVDETGVHLELDAEAANELPRFEHTYAVTDVESGYPEVIPGPLQSMVLFSKPPAGKTYLNRGHLFELEPLSGGEDAPESPLIEGGVVVGKGAEVFGSDGVKVGNVHEVAYAEDGELAEITVQTGRIRHHTHAVADAEIAEIGDEEIVLSVPAATVTARTS